MCRSYRVKPSELIDLKTWASDLLGAPDWFTAFQFDAAVSYFGNFIDGKLAETDDDHKPVHTLSDLLDDKPSEKRVATDYSRLKRVPGIVVR